MNICPNDFKNLCDDAQMIQAAVDAAFQTGARVVIPRRNERTGADVWVLSRAVKLYTGSAITLDNCRLRLADDAFDNLFKNSVARTNEAARFENRQYDIHIEGVGDAVLDGGNHNGLVERNAKEKGMTPLVNTLVHLQNAERIAISNLRVVNARFWGLTFHFCANARISNIHFQSIGNCPNQDGIDLRFGCRDFIIENITGYTQDDTIALTCLNDAAVKRVEGMDASIHNVIIRNIAACSLCATIRLLNHYGGKLYNVLIENVQSSVEIDPADPAADAYALRLPAAPEVAWAMKPAYWATFENRNRRAGACVRIGENGYFDQNALNSRAKLGDTFNISVRNVQTNAKMGIAVARTLCDSRFENIQLFGDAAFAVYFSEGEFENITCRDISYARGVRPREADFTPCEGNYGYQRVAPVYFNHSHARRLFFSGVSAPAYMPAVFSGEGDVALVYERLRTSGAQAAVVVGDGIRATDAANMQY